MARLSHYINEISPDASRMHSIRMRIAMAGWLHGVFVGDWLFVFPLCGFSLSLFCNSIRKLVMPSILRNWTQIGLAINI